MYLQISQRGFPSATDKGAEEWSLLPDRLFFHLQKHADKVKSDCDMGHLLHKNANLSHTAAAGTVAAISTNREMRVL